MSVTYYWRPGCGFCMALERKLQGAGVPLDKRNIWEEPDAADYVRSVANGNETVPTVVVGDTAMVNPRADEVLRAIAAEDPGMLPDDDEIPQPGRAARFITRVLGG